jgi:hypothetical protein
MCNNKQFLSIYFDGELPSPWKEQMEQHLENCPDCVRGIETYKKTSELLNGGKAGSLDKRDSDNAIYDDGVMEAAKSRVWEKISVSRQQFSLYKGPRRRLRLLLRQPLNIPGSLTAAAAGALAATALIFIISFIMPSRSNENKLPEISSSTMENIGGIPVSSDYALDLPEITPALNMDDLLHYLENNDSSNIVIIKLPERKKFNRYGEPTFINAADYRRGPAN